MTTADLRPMTLGEVLDRTFTLYKRNFWLFAGIMSFPLILVFFAQVGIAAFRTTAPGTAPGSSALFLGAFGRFVILMIVSMVMYAIAQAATIFAVSDLYLGRTATVRAAFGKVRGRILRTIGVIFLVGLIV